ncbi:MAG: hypothetical protein MSH58_08550 [Clostridiales bacterium]|nr:hypothetical protein [Clostridiales bacterium]
MKISKLASAMFFAAGTVLLVGSVVMSFAALSRPAKAVKPTQEANACAQSVIRALDDGDLSKVEEYFYGKPTLGLEREPATAEGKQIWNAYRDSITVTTDGYCYGEGTNIYQTAKVTAMDITGTLSQWDKGAGELLKQKIDAAEDPAVLLDEGGDVPQTLKDELCAQALTQVLADAKTVTTQITFQLMEQDGQWWVLPDQAMLDVLSGAVK